VDAPKTMKVAVIAHIVLGGPRDCMTVAHSNRVEKQGQWRLPASVLKPC
jgi:hypothetical protein